MIRYLGPDEIDRQQWDDLLTRAPNGLIYGLSWYLDIVSPGWAALVKEEAGRYVAVLPLPIRRKFGLNYLQQPVFAQQLGLFYLELPTSSDWQKIEQLLYQRFQLITHYAFNVNNPELLRVSQPGLMGLSQNTYYLSLRPSYLQLVANYKANRRWRLNQARRRDLHIELTTNINLMVKIFSENTAPKIYGIIGEAYEYRILRSLYVAACEQGMANLWQVRTATGEVVAMGLLFKFKQQITYIFNCSTMAGKAYGAISLLLDELFRIHAGQDVCFDFEAPEVPNVAHFYSSFGSKPVPFLTISTNRLPWPVRQLKAARMKLYQRLRPRPSSDAS